MHILLTGSRKWSDEQAVWEVLDIIAKEAFAIDDSVTLVHGACPLGADAMGERWYLARRGFWPVTVERYPADWERHGRRAGFIRNEQMVERGAHVCLAFIANSSPGATHCADLAERAEITVRRFTR